MSLPGLRDYLAALAAAGRTATYAEAAAALDVPAPHRIHRLTGALEATMAEDAAAGRPFAAAVIVSRARAGLPAPGFFEAARRLGRHAGEDDGPEAAAFVAAERAALSGGGR